jgi:hypothetical protein
MIKELEGLLKCKDELNLSNQFITDSNTELLRMKDDLRYRRELEEEARLAAE